MKLLLILKVPRPKGSEFRIKRDPAKLLDSAVARPTQTFVGFLTQYGFVMRTMFSLLVVLTTAIIASGQTSSELRAKYGAPQTVELENNRVVVERFLVRAAIQMTIRYTTDGEPCEAVLQPVPNSTAKAGRAEHAPEGDFMVTAEVIKVIDEVLPFEKRGKKLSAIHTDGGDPEMKLHHPGCPGFDVAEFEKAYVSAVSWCWGGTFSATIHWGKTTCSGQTIKPKQTGNTPPNKSLDASHGSVFLKMLY